MAILSPNPAMQDLKITVQESTLVFPSQETERKTLFLSNIDQFLNFDIPTIRFFSANPDFPPEIVAKRLKVALEKVLVSYDFVAGRLRWNPKSSCLEIDCNAAGAGFVVASSEFSLDEIGDLACPNLGFRQLAVPKLGPNSHADQPMCTLQVTSFKCGGFTIGLSNNHILLDGLAAKMFEENIASQAFDNKPLPFIPFHDRRRLEARSPPLVTFSHPEFFLPELPLLEPPNLVIKQDLDFKVLKLSSKDINLLKAKAKAETDNPTAVKITTFNVIAALIWRCIALSSCELDNSKDRISSVLNTVDLRPKLNPPLPSEFCGNAILFAYSSSKCEDLEAWPFSKLVEKVSEGIARVTDEYAKSAIDYMEIYKGIPYGDIIVTSWLRLGFHEVVYPWGKPDFCGPVVNDMDRICWVFPNPRVAADDDDGDRVYISIQRPPQEMERFQFHFHNFFKF